MYFFQQITTDIQISFEKEKTEECLIHISVFILFWQWIIFWNNPGSADDKGSETVAESSLIENVPTETLFELLN